MTSHNIEPGRSGGTAGARKCDHVGALISSENIVPPLDYQAFRVAHIARRHRVSPIAAGVVASICFGEARR